MKDKSDQSPSERYIEAQRAFEQLLAQDFPDFVVEQYATEKAEAEGVNTERLSGKLWTEARSFPSRLDLTGDGKIGLDDAQAFVGKAAEGIGKTWKSAASSAAHATAEAKQKAANFDYSSAVNDAVFRAKESAQGINADSFRASRHSVARIGKTASGIQGIQNRSIAHKIKQVCSEYAEAAEALTEERRGELNRHIEVFGALRLQALHETLAKFLEILEDLKQHNRVKEYELLAGLGIDTKTFEALGSLDMSVQESLRATATAGALGIAAVLGTPVIVTGTVTAFATASTGTAISTLSGAAASNAVLAWLGGGSIASGGAGMAAGQVVLTGITAGATAGVTLLASGILISTHYARKLTEAKTYEKDIALGVANLEKAWMVMDAIADRVDELTEVTEELHGRLVPLLSQLEALVPVFDASNKSHATIFNQCGLLVKTMVELSQVPLLGEEGELTDESLSVTVHVKTILNTEV